MVLSRFSGILPVSSELQAQGCPSAHKSTFLSTGPRRDGMTQRLPHRRTSQEESWVPSLASQSASAPTTSLIELWCGPSEASSVRLWKSEVSERRCTPGFLPGMPPCLLGYTSLQSSGSLSSAHRRLRAILYPVHTYSARWLLSQLPSPACSGHRWMPPL